MKITADSKFLNITFGKENMHLGSYGVILHHHFILNIVL